MGRNQCKSQWSSAKPNTAPGLSSAHWVESLTSNHKLWQPTLWRANLYMECYICTWQVSGKTDMIFLLYFKGFELNGFKRPMTQSAMTRIVKKKKIKNEMESKSRVFITACIHSKSLVPSMIFSHWKRNIALKGFGMQAFVCIGLDPNPVGDHLGLKMIIKTSRNPHMTGHFVGKPSH